jgi:hypothetical protein
VPATDDRFTIAAFEPRADADAHGQCDYPRQSRFGITSPFGGTQQSGLGATAPKASWNTSTPKPSACPTDSTTVDIQQIGDRLTIGALLNRSARAVDTKDWGTRACSS